MGSTADAAAEHGLVARLGLQRGQVVQELGWDEDVDEEFRAALQDAVDSDLADEDSDDVADLVVCGEPILRAVLGLPPIPGAGCGVETVRVTPRGAVVPCVYGADAALGLRDLARRGPAIVDDPSFARLRAVPPACEQCPHVETCRGGCASRRALKGDLSRADEYCPFVRGETVDLHA